MMWLTLLALSLGLAADATAVAIASALATPRVRVRDALLLAAMFGLAQAVMPLIGFAIGDRFAGYVEAWDHWLVLAVLGGIGAKMIYEAVAHDPAEESPIAGRRPFALRTLFVMAVATSIDALAAGLTLPLLGFHLAVAAAVIGAVTLLLCFGAAMLGQRLGAAAERKLDIYGGAILVLLGVKTVVEHVLLGAG